jgi:hypothetical protein
VADALVDLELALKSVADAGRLDVASDTLATEPRDSRQPNGG